MGKHQDNQILLYETEDGETRVEVLYEGETVWLTQTQMAQLFQIDKSTISRHIKNAIETDELDEESVVAFFATTASDGKHYKTAYYNLDMIIAVGYRINSRRGTQFRIWATRRLREYVIKGFVIDDQRLKNGGSNYFDELYERVRRIRVSEAQFYLKVRSIFATSIDYNNASDEAKEFYATVQNKFHYAIHGHTAAELIVQRVNGRKNNMGLTSWNSTIVTQKDAVIAKNYLTEIEMKRLELLVDQFLSFAELQSVEQRPMYMRDWIKKLDDFIRLNDKQVLTSAGTVSRKDMETRVRQELEAYRDRVMAEEALEEDEFRRMLDDAAVNMLLPPDEDLEDHDKITREEYLSALSRISKVTKKNPGR